MLLHWASALIKLKILHFYVWDYYPRPRIEVRMETPHVTVKEVLIKDVVRDSCTQRGAKGLYVGSSRRWESKLNVLSHLHQVLQKEELKTTVKGKSQGTTGFREDCPCLAWSRDVSRERGMREREILNLMFIFQVFFPVHTFQKLIRAWSLDSNQRELSSLST